MFDVLLISWWLLLEFSVFKWSFNMSCLKKVFRSEGFTIFMDLLKFDFLRLDILKIIKLLFRESK